jgi:Leucine Rich repeats (2 copies)
MKKYTLLFLFFSLVNYSQIINFTDPVFKAKLLSATTSNYIAGNASGTSIKIDTNNDGQIQVSEALNVVYLRVNNSNISSISGIEYFTNIKYLYCISNSLTTLPISNLTQLRLLECQNNQLTDLAAIQNLTQLTDLDFSFNQITSIALQNLSNLSFVIAENNLLNEIDVCGTNVYRLYCGDNPNLTSINLKNNVVTDVPYTFEGGTFPGPPFHTLLLQNLPLLNNICHDVGEYNALTAAISNFSTTNLSQITFSTSCFTCTDRSLVNLKLNIQGYYDSQTQEMKPAKYNQGISANPTDVDDITVELRTNTGILVDTAIATLKTNGTAVCSFNTAPVGSFFITVKNENMIQSYSSSLQNVGRIPLTYDFTNSVTKAFGDNLVQLSNGKYAFYSGDLNDDGNVDNSDYSLWEIDANNFAYGFYVTDLNGDGNVDNSDYSIWETNSNNFVSIISPF